MDGALNWPNSFHICGDNHPLAWSRTLQNVQAVNRKLANENNSIRLDIFQWDACSLPLRNSSVDVFVTDLPFGKRMGSKFDNRKLYPSLLNEMARVCKNKNGRAVLLTQDKKTMSQEL
ncbi:THUMP domain-containing protein 3-like [Centruroides sculpturatus]|uniref:THUMP domain-containing protein 3-like n=1 Tax=Centruroides sculpturatus TaxID=218467 RepID=UPI000C6ED09D|nr:THUMP domain-containing protein 3-like [Centruroides sculpturatus]